MKDPAQQRIYDIERCISFRNTKERFGGLSNMAGGFPLEVAEIPIPSAEALYQASRFPHQPLIQRLVLEPKSPMTAKMVSRHHTSDSRSDWNAVRVRVMRWVLRVKLATHWTAFGDLLLATEALPIVEDSPRDDFWGALRTGGALVGANVLGRLLMELREELRAKSYESLRVAMPPSIPNFLLLGKKVGSIGPFSVGPRGIGFLG